MFVCACRVSPTLHLGEFFRFMSVSDKIFKYEVMIKHYLMVMECDKVVNGVRDKMTVLHT